MNVKIKRLHPDAIIPQYQTAGAAGFDLHTISEGILLPKERVLLKTGLSIEIPHGYEMQIRPRSGLAWKHGVTVLNSPGTIDSDYRGEIGIILVNLGHLPFKIEKGDRIAQGVIVPIIQAEFTVVEELSETERGDGGFGSTGKGLIE